MQQKAVVQSFSCAFNNFHRSLPCLLSTHRAHQLSSPSSPSRPSQVPLSQGFEIFKITNKTYLKNQKNSYLLYLLEHYYWRFFGRFWCNRRKRDYITNLNTFYYGFSLVVLQIIIRKFSS